MGKISYTRTARNKRQKKKATKQTSKWNTAAWIRAPEEDKQRQKDDGQKQRQNEDIQNINRQQKLIGRKKPKRKKTGKRHTERRPT